MSEIEVGDFVQVIDAEVGQVRYIKGGYYGVSIVNGKGALYEWTLDRLVKLTPEEAARRSRAMLPAHLFA